MRPTISRRAPEAMRAGISVDPGAGGAKSNSCPHPGQLLRSGDGGGSSATIALSLQRLRLLGNGRNYNGVIHRRPHRAGEAVNTPHHHHKRFAFRVGHSAPHPVPVGRIAELNAELPDPDLTFATFCSEGGDARLIWVGRTRDEALCELQSFPGIGAHKAQVAVYLLSDLLGVMIDEEQTFPESCPALVRYLTC